MGDGQQEGVTIRPTPKDWGVLLRAGDTRLAAQRGGEAVAPGAIIITGHQPVFWHPGILAKYLAVDAAARATGAEPVWLVVDQGRPATVEVRYPARVEGRLVSRSILFGGDTGPEAPADGAAPFVREGLQRIIQAMAGARGEATLSQRVGRALETLLAPLVTRTGRTLYATELWKLPVFGDLVERMRAQPERCVLTYNDAVARHASAGIRPLVADQVQDRWELPLWRLPPGEPRRRVYAEDLPTTPREQLAPRALVMTGMLRMSECSLFVHGTGGGGGEDDDHEGYDTVTEEWLRDWLGGVALAPQSVVTATRRLPLGVPDCPGEREIARVRWRAHHARHAPADLGDRAATAEKAGALAAMRTPDRGVRAAQFRRMHGALDAYRSRHTAELAALDREAGEIAGRCADAAVAADRTWPFPLYPHEMLLDLKREIDAAFGVA
jgi:hypothetical protein